ncbi:MAG: hypothetical protein IKP73_13645 [Bacteroidales bacterium]|nr:hypothetical protein [Bacteroidales bacterium]MBR4326560.1 hypothetical protein [Bacteroidales bacterium]
MMTLIKYRVVLLLLAIVSCTSSCMAQDAVVNESITQHYNRLFKEKVGDSIANIILDAKSVEIMCDSVQKKLSANEIAIAQYIVADTCNLSEGYAVDGLFYNYLSFKFVTKKKSITICYDFVLDKMRIYSAEGKKLAERDIKSALPPVRFGLLAFPDNKYLKQFNTGKK